MFLISISSNAMETNSPNTTFAIKGDLVSPIGGLSAEEVIE